MFGKQVFLYVNSINLFLLLFSFLGGIWEQDKAVSALEFKIIQVTIKVSKILILICQKPETYDLVKSFIYLCSHSCAFLESQDFALKHIRKKKKKHIPIEFFLYKSGLVWGFFGGFFGAMQASCCFKKQTDDHIIKQNFGKNFKHHSCCSDFNSLSCQQS